ncbi:Brix domain-containing protein C4F8.04 [Protomyces lactucae-debilis]|uniref:Brix domain-containing protein C4F8.04 n=1 Tax=Protomyces lactucae-debilis TaxID=2754530 RepID=A0A1Y2F6N4_PROLT|nr:Brix domain-containing protein C4F8.04 [Protomyces lactucae-debilis]ORY79558.1 Brix domain-containing protein C4F8.04 [Protomyces lactucae-debilis]
MTKNKLIRSDNYNDRKHRLGKEKSLLRRERAKLEEQDPTLRVRRQQAHVPETVDMKRRFDPSRRSDLVGQQVQTDSNLVLKEEDEAAKAQEEVKQMTEGKRTLITTSPNPTKISYHFMTVLQSIFPLSDTIRRGTGKYTIPEIAKFASNRGYSNLIVVNEDRKEVNAISFIKLPGGPTAYFTITSLQLRQLATHTTHHPELILQNFTTALGQSIASIFQSLVPTVPQIQGRQTLTLHNSRDFIFFRRHRYLFAGAGDKVRLQEIGPRFTLKCREVMSGVARGGELVWESNAGLESDRKRLFL